MKILAIDTSTEQASVALMVEGNVISEEKIGLRQHAQWILPMIQQLLAQAELPFTALTGIAFGCGPGSFTGLRVACSVAKGLAYAHDLPLFSVSTLLAIAAEVYEREGDLAKNNPVLAMLDARMQQVYWGWFENGLAIGEEQVSSPSVITMPPTPVIIAGVELQTILPTLPPLTILKHCVIYPRATAMIRLVQKGIIPPCDVASALPVYIRNQVTQGGRSNG